ncbi:hypothetical protein GIY56_16650 [Paracoccus sp. YIM 132242]|uniref:DNA-binding phage zinc finger domain-containing protein n=1 Tax=Paracoccus lichenicola TaxID=2665644 RepID=A0A6L6HUH0_9RHOB|nr:hypothetical protein [Paracoccus lichenicola]MTE01921.1 hypothetical protein [Paracoccus lichenicola]
MPDFTAHRHPALAVSCPICGEDCGHWCRTRNGRTAGDLHDARQAEADRQFIEQHGYGAAMVHAASGWLVDPRGCARD